VSNQLTGSLCITGKSAANRVFGAVPVAGGEESKVSINTRLDSGASGRVAEKGTFLYHRGEPDQPLIEFFAFSSGKVSRVMTLNKRIPDTISGLTISQMAIACLVSAGPSKQ
jgi:hypothetical protein